MIRNEDRVRAVWRRIKANEELSIAGVGMDETWDSVKRLIPKKDRMRKIRIFPDTPVEMAECIKAAGLTVLNQYDTEFATIFAARKEKFPMMTGQNTGTSSSALS